MNWTKNKVINGEKKIVHFLFFSLTSVISPVTTSNPFDFSLVFFICFNSIWHKPTKLETTKEKKYGIVEWAMYLHLIGGILVFLFYFVNFYFYSLLFLLFFLFLGFSFFFFFFASYVFFFLSSSFCFLSCFSFPMILFLMTFLFFFFFFLFCHLFFVCFLILFFLVWSCSFLFGRVFYCCFCFSFVFYFCFVFFSRIFYGYSCFFLFLLFSHFSPLCNNGRLYHFFLLSSPFLLRLLWSYSGVFCRRISSLLNPDVNSRHADVNGHGNHINLCDVTRS